ncbi:MULTISPECIES: DUF6602 domain-containing protein [unclassified Providencia]|uniref:DUF6602 domain-containing protein n=1 Tax=unclassified Providencia TaxID=2633465 RepID=UPI002348FA1D|nr:MULTISPECIES: DUF6602 domain-containing protein [unclassified Providencia]
MIRNSADLLEKFIDEERKHVQKQKMPHMPTLGNAYEKITQCGLSERFVLPDNLDLKVVSGFIKIGEDVISGQIDCMLVTGDGEKYGLTDNYYYDIENVLVIFEVKKTLNKNELIAAYEHLSEIKQKTYDYFYAELYDSLLENPSEKVIENYHKIIDKICNEKSDDVNTVVLNNLNLESILPLHIIHGYDGYTTEKGFRTGFLNFLEERLGKEGYGIASLPNLIMVDDFTITKATGFPYLALYENKYTPIVSSNIYSCWIMLELIWDKIARYFNINLLYQDENLDLEKFIPLVSAKLLRNNNSFGWEFISHEFSIKTLARIRENMKCWEPLKISKAALSILSEMFLFSSTFDIESIDSSSFHKEYSISLDDVILEITNTNFFRQENNILFMITKNISLIETNDGNSWVFMTTEVDKLNLWMNEKGLISTSRYVLMS